jgi:hypothetical protein
VHSPVSQMASEAAARLNVCPVGMKVGAGTLAGRAVLQTMFAAGFGTVVRVGMPVDEDEGATVDVTSYIVEG